MCGEFTGTGEFPAQRASYAENASIWWRHHVWQQSQGGMNIADFWRLMLDITQRVSFLVNLPRIGIEFSIAIVLTHYLAIWTLAALYIPSTKTNRSCKFMTFENVDQSVQTPIS